MSRDCGDCALRSMYRHAKCIDGMETFRRIGSNMETKFQIFLLLLAVLAGTALLARRINIAPAILLLLAGTALAFVPGAPALELPPEIVLLVVLPPLIYYAGVAMSWREFRFNLRPIILLSVG